MPKKAMEPIDLLPVPQLRTGMLVSKTSKPGKGEITKLADYTGKCDKGLHFGNECYNLITEWWVWQ